MASSSTADHGELLENDDMGSLFEGMVLFTTPTAAVLSDYSPPPPPPPPDADDEDTTTDHHQNNKSQTSQEAHNSLSSSLTSSSASAPPSLPLDENLFADLSLMVENPQKEEILEEDHHPPRPPSSATLQISLSRKKKRAAGLRIGYGRDRVRDQDISFNANHQLSKDQHQDQDRDHPPLPAAGSVPIENDEEQKKRPEAAALSSPSPSQFQEDENEVEQATSKPVTGTIDIRFEEIRALISQKLNIARQAVSSVSAARKDSIRKRRKAAHLLSDASAKYLELERELEEACEAEDFEKAERLGDSLASADKDREHLQLALRDAEAHSDALEFKMREALEYQILAEEECASLLRKFSLDASNDADLVLENAEAVFSREMENWTSTTEEVELKRLQLGIESHLMNEAQSALHDSIVHSTQDDHTERDILYKRREILTEELQKLHALVKEKEMEIAENDCNIERVEKRVAGVVSDFEEVHSGLDEKLTNLQSGLHQLDLEYQLLSQRKKQIDDDLCLEEARGKKVREISKISADEAKMCQEVIRLRKSLMQFSLKFLENKIRLFKTEQQLTEDVSVLRQEITAARTSLQELSSSKSSIQKEIESFKQRLFFIDKRVPELEAEKKVAAAARNFKEAARIATEAKTLCIEREGLGIKMGDATLQLQKLEEQIGIIIHRLEETETQVLLKTKELEVARFQRLILVADAATAERSAALDLGDLEEANALSAEADAAAADARRLQLLYSYKDEDFVNQTKHFFPLELVSKLGVKQLAELVTAFDTSIN